MDDSENLINAILEEGKEITINIKIVDSKKARCILKSLFHKESSGFGFVVNEVGFINQVDFLQSKLNTLKTITELHHQEVMKIYRDYSVSSLASVFKKGD